MSLCGLLIVVTARDEKQAHCGFWASFTAIVCRLPCVDLTTCLVLLHQLRA